MSGFVAARVRVLVVDDTVIQRRLVTAVLASDPRVEVIGEAVDGLRALDQVKALRPDVMVLDLEMPNLDGLGVLKALRLEGGYLPAVVVYSTLSERGAAITLDALSLGANDFALKPHHAGSRDAALLQVRSELVSKVVALGSPRSATPGGGRVTGTPSLIEHASTARAVDQLREGPLGRDTRQTSPPVKARPEAPVPRARRAPTPEALVQRTRATRLTSRTGARVTRTPEAIVLASSTGGPSALAEVLEVIPATLRAPILIVQHMPPTYTRMLAERLDRQCALTVREAYHGAEVLPGDVWIAPGDHHMVVTRAGDATTLVLTKDPLVQSVRPAADVLFKSAAAVWGARTLGVVLTGMGTDATDGAAAIVQAGGRVIVQDAATSAVWGMPGSVVAAGLTDEIFPIQAVAGVLVASHHRSEQLVQEQR